MRQRVGGAELDGALEGRARLRLAELRKRSVIRALVAYSVGAWMLLQVADVTFDRLPITSRAR